MTFLQRRKNIDATPLYKCHVHAGSEDSKFGLNEWGQVLFQKIFNKYQLR